ncbi:MAG: DNA-binding protein [Candidatus Dadabacteria bacterium]|nr:DUF177 domain-containing protein [Flavobacteriaceae bacterium]GIS05842.1 MAG: DNA-binding protein [Candidatus Dadabacteria bacterium]|tara:strand:- start:1 stop:519 length:519 start_codon:yes stop_codon:yes gene_type:complete
MKSLSPYLIKFSGLKEGIHLFNYEIGNKFFKNFDYYDFLDAKLFAKLELEKQSTLLNLKFSFNGEIEVQCDVSMESFDLKLETEHAVVVKFKDDIISTDDKVIFMPAGSHSIDVSHLIYESIILAVPQKKVHPGIENGSLKSEIVEKLEELRPKKNFNEKTDPRWDKLKDLL